MYPEDSETKVGVYRNPLTYWLVYRYPETLRQWSVCVQKQLC